MKFRRSDVREIDVEDIDLVESVANGHLPCDILTLFNCYYFFHSALTVFFAF